MPELPQVQTVRRFIEQVCMLPKPKKIKNIKAFYPQIIKNIDPSIFIKNLIGQTFTDIDRYGKHLILKFNDYSIISHLRMEGKYIWYDKKYQQEKHDHIQFIFTDGNSLVYNDVRKFGTMHLVKKGEELMHPSISKLGPEVNDQSTFTVQYLQSALKNKSKRIKEVLLDQETICGIGNIYADQILFAAKVNPQRVASRLNGTEIRDIVKYGKIIIDRAIENNGTTIRSFSSNHESGSNQNILNVYGQQNSPCKKCNSFIKKIKVGGRGTHFCPKCQK